MLERRSPLGESRQPGLYGAVVSDAPGVELREIGPIAAVQVAAFDEEAAVAAIAAATGLAAPRGRNGVAAAGETVALWTGPARWLLVEPETRDLAALLARQCKPEVAAIADLGHARAVIRIEGPAAGKLLAKLCTLDFDAAGFPQGTCAQTLIGQVGVLLHRRAEPSFDLLVYRGFAVSAWETIFDAALEFGCKVR